MTRLKTSHLSQPKIVTLLLSSVLKIVFQVLRGVMGLLVMAFRGLGVRSLGIARFLAGTSAFGISLGLFEWIG